MSATVSPVDRADGVGDRCKAALAVAQVDVEPVGGEHGKVVDAATWLTSPMRTTAVGLCGCGGLPAPAPPP